MTTTMIAPVSESILHKVRSLINKANASEYSPEAEAFFAKAQELISRYEIDAALLRDADPAAASRPISRKITISGTYASARGSLLNTVGRASGVRVIRTRKVQGGFVYDLIGFESDINMVEFLFTELDLYLAQAVSRVSNADLFGYRESLRAYRTSFTYGFSSRIGQRLLDSKMEAEKSAKEAERAANPSGLSSSVALALVNKDRAVAAEVKNLYPRLTSTKRTSSSRGGYKAGFAAGGNANLNRNKAVR